jgi:hypothetical protein
MKPTKFPALNKSDIVKLIDEVGQSIQAIAQTEAKKLAKADLPPPTEGSESSSSSGSSSSSSPSAGSEGSLSGGSEGSMGDGGGAPAGPPPGAPSGAPPSAGPPPDAGASAGPPSGGPSGAPGPGGEQAPAGPSFEELVSLYASLPPEDLEAHAAAMQQALQMKQGGQPGAPGASPSAPPAGPPGASPSAPPGAPPMGKQEVATATSTGPVIGLEPGGGTPGKVATHNPNIGTKKSEVEDLGERLAKATSDLEKMGEVIQTMLTIPQRKAVTTVGGITIIPMRKSEPTVGAAKKPFEDLTKAELHIALTEATKPTNNKLSKNERDVVSEYYTNPANVKLDAIAAIYAKL